MKIDTSFLLLRFENAFKASVQGIKIHTLKLFHITSHFRESEGELKVDWSKYCLVIGCQ